MRRGCLSALWLLVALAFCCGCQRRHDEPKDYAVGFGQQRLGKSGEQICWILQHAVDGPRFAVVWKADARGATVTADLQGRLYQINGRRVKVDFDKRDVYALQPDYTVLSLWLTDESVQHVLELLRRSLPSPQQPLEQDEIWKWQVAPKLKLVTRGGIGGEGSK